MKTKLYLEARGTASQATGLWTHSFSLKLIYYLLSYLSQSQQDRLVQRCLSLGLMTYRRVLGCRQVEGKNVLPQLTSTDMPWHACAPTHIKINMIYIYPSEIANRPLQHCPPHKENTWFLPSGPSFVTHVVCGPHVHMHINKLVVLFSCNYCLCCRGVSNDPL